MSDRRFDLAEELSGVTAPDTLRRSVEEMTSIERAGARRYGWIVAPAVVMVVTAVLLILAPFGSSDPTVDSVVAQAASGPTAGAPSASGSVLDASVGDVAFPNWAEDHGWEATGERSAELNGREVRTVFYSAPGGGQIRYTIVGGSPIDAVEGGSYDVSGSGEKRRVVWRRNGHTCIVESEGVEPAKLESALGFS